MAKYLVQGYSNKWESILYAVQSDSEIGAIQRVASLTGTKLGFYDVDGAKVYLLYPTDFSWEYVKDTYSVDGPRKFWEMHVILLEEDKDLNLAF